MRTAIVTGGSRGIGRAVVRKLAADGFRVIFTYSHDAAAANAVEAEEARLGSQVKAIRCDQAVPSEHAGLLERARPQPSDTQYLDALIVNAGIIDHGFIADTTEATFDRVFAVNVRGPFFLMQEASRQLKDGGRIVCISSTSTAWPSRGEAVYAASKGALEQVCRVASRELGARGITVNIVSPGPTDTDMLRGAVDEGTLAALAHMTALGRVGTPTDVAGIVSLLLRPEAAWVTGQNIRADGGLT
ncbi:SDR family oxidoreductase [Archangium violaceum]|uniref:SDR family oxidoreductase n=1 Tax=Archangium violaceum TaxID=83451 RepID=UPI002B3252AA|nr:SDR family oxidoreductase [Archangium violaceum]